MTTTVASRGRILTEMMADAGGRTGGAPVVSMDLGVAGVTSAARVGANDRMGVDR